MSFPLFFGKCNEENILCDDTRYFSYSFDIIGIKEILSFGYTLGNRTIFQGVQLIGAGNI